MTKWKLEDEISTYPYMNSISIMIYNEKKTRHINLWLSLDEAEEFTNNMLDEIKYCKETIKNTNRVLKDLKI